MSEHTDADRIAEDILTWFEFRKDLSIVLGSRCSCTGYYENEMTEDILEVLHKHKAVVIRSLSRDI